MNSKYEQGRIEHFKTRKEFKKRKKVMVGLAGKPRKLLKKTCLGQAALSNKKKSTENGKEASTYSGP